MRIYRNTGGIASAGRGYVWDIPGAYVHHAGIMKRRIPEYDGMKAP